MIDAQKIYIAGPYSDPDPSGRQRNVDAAISTGVALLKRGHFPFIPHLTHFVDEWTRSTAHVLAWEDYIAWDLIWLAECDALFYLGSSRGADLELQVAERLGKPVYRTLADVPPGTGVGGLGPTAADALERELCGRVA